MKNTRPAPRRRLAPWMVVPALLATGLLLGAVRMAPEPPADLDRDPRQDVAAGDTAQQATATPGTSGEKPLGLEWSRVREGDALFVEVDGQARAWARLADPGGGPDEVVLASPRRPLERWPSLDAVVDERLEEILRLGSLRDFFAVDRAARRVWVGARHRGDGGWTTVSRDSTGVGGGLSHASRVLLDAEGRAGVPWRAIVDCPTPGGCIEHGLDRFTADGELDAELRFEAAPGADRDELLASHLLPPKDDAAASWVVGRREMVELSDLDARIAYPALVDDTGAPNAGYATAGTRRPDGAVLVFMWAERRDRPTLVHELSAVAWRDGRWAEALPATVLTAAPFLSGDPAFDRIVAADFDALERLWLVGNTGGVGVRSANGATWSATWSAEGLGLPADARIRDIAVAADGVVWLATSDGLWAGARPVAGTIYLPSMVR